MSENGETEKNCKNCEEWEAEEKERHTMLLANGIAIEKCRNCSAPKELYAQERIVFENPELIRVEYRPRCSITKRLLDVPSTDTGEVIEKIIACLDKEIEINKGRENESATVWDRGFYNGCATEAMQLRVKIREILKDGLA